jgi:hypothetical protein
MTMDEFEMDPHSRPYFRNEIEWDIKARDGDIKIEFSVYDENIQEAVKDNFDSFSETVVRELTERIESKWDNGEISDEDKAAFIRILGKVIG